MVCNFVSFININKLSINLIFGYFL